jgi:hypothetical protein
MNSNQIRSQTLGREPHSGIEVGVGRHVGRSAVVDAQQAVEIELCPASVARSIAKHQLSRPRRSAATERSAL